MILHVLLCICFWHCEASAAAIIANPAANPVGARFCKVGYRQSWPGEFVSANIKNIDSTHFWAQLPVINNYLTSLLVFTISFFNQQAFTKMSACLAASGAAMGALNNLTYCLIALVPDRARGRNILRLAHAFHRKSPRKLRDACIVR
jgi:hypothetical protein